MRSWTVFAAARVFAMALVVSSNGVAAPRVMAALQWSAPADCPGASDVKTRLEAIVGPVLAANVDASVTVTHDSTYVAEVRIRGRSRFRKR